jgi:hypothetical protein
MTKKQNAEYQKKWREANAAKIKIAQRRAYKKYRETWIEIAASVIDLKCSCGEDRFVCLDFHHLDPSLKCFSISQVMGKWATTKIHIEQFLAEVEKCIVLCANCHRVLHQK